MTKSSYNRVTELFKEYKKKLTGSDENTSPRVFDFIYEHNPDHQTEILDFIYEQAFEDGQKTCVEKGRKSVNSLTLVKSEPFGNVQCDFYSDDNEIWMTRKQIGEALEYANPQKAIDKIHERNKDRLDKYSVTVKLGGTDGKQYDTTLYNANGIYEICRWSRQPKANAFFDWVYDVLEGLRKGQLQIHPTSANGNHESQRQEFEIRKAELLIKMAEQFRDIVPNQVIQSILANAVKTVGFDASMFTPEQSKRGYTYMTATDIALEAGTTSHMIGILSNQYKLKQPEYGRWVSAFVYNEKGKRKLLELIRKEDKRRLVK